MHDSSMHDSEQHAAGRPDDDTSTPHSGADPQPDDPYREPENSTTEEWFGSSVDRDTELAEQLVEQEDGDLAAAAERFEQEATGAEEQRERHDG